MTNKTSALAVFDTSALVAISVRQHLQFDWADAQFTAKRRAALCNHSLAELYAVLTGSPQFHFAPAEALGVLESLTEQLEILPLSTAQYLKAASRCQALHLPGGAIYDTLLATVALDAGANALVTPNPEHFRRLGEDIERLVVCPD